MLKKNRKIQKYAVGTLCQKMAKYTKPYSLYFKSIDYNYNL